MTLNLLIIVFVLGMAVMWATYGLFSALIHLLVVIVSGALAFGLWEVFAYKLFLNVTPMYGWSLALILPFVVFVIVLRLATDRLIRGNLQVPGLANQIGGGACGAASGILTTGIGVIGIGFLPLPPDIAGFRPYEVQSNGVVAEVPGGQLWLSVDVMADRFFSKLSGGAFYTRTPLASYLPDVSKQAAVFRLAKFYNPDQSVVATPGEVTATGSHRFTGQQIPGVGAAVSSWLLSHAGEGSILLVNTQWDRQEGGVTHDEDSLLRVPPTQIRLALRPPHADQLLAPIGFSKEADDRSVRFWPIANNQIYASSLFSNQQINWVFALPEGAQPNFLLARNTRVLLPAMEDAEPAEFAKMVGRLAEADESAAAVPPPPASRGGSAMEITTDPSGYSAHKAVSIEQTAALPLSVSKNKIQFANYTDEGAVRYGRGIAGSGAGGRGNSVDRVLVSDSLRPLRLRMVPMGAQTFVGQAGQGQPAGNVQEIWLSDTRGSTHRPFAWVIKLADGRQSMRVEPMEFRNNTDLPLNDLREGDELYVYWRVPPGTTIERYNIGSAQQDIGFEVQ